MPESRATTPRANGFRPYGVAAIAFAGALLSVLKTGFVFGVDNNAFHLPIVARLYDAPQFANDTFVQSLRFYASGVWLLLQGTERFVDPYWLFLGLSFISRLIAFSGFLACASLLGVRTLTQQAIFAAVLSLAAIMQGLSYGGRGDLFRSYFTHSEFPIGLTLWAIYFTARGRLVPAVVLHGAVFFVNLFVAVWNALAFAAQVVHAVTARQLAWRKVAADCAIGAAFALPLALPVVWNLAKNIRSADFGRSLDFDFVAYLRGYYPYHYLFDSIDAVERIGLLSVVLLAGLSFAALGRAARPFLAVLGGYLAVYAIAIVVPELTSSYYVLNFQFLRVSVMFHLLAALGAIALAVNWLMEGAGFRARVVAPVLIFSLCAGAFTAMLAPLIALMGLWIGKDRPAETWILRSGALAGILALVYAAAVLPKDIRQVAVQQRSIAALISEWMEIGQWIRGQTAPQAVFLLPVARFTEAPAADEIASEAWQAAVTATIFEFASRRRAWVDFKRGAVVMIHPPYHKEWRQRIGEALALKSHDERVAYARKNGIGFVIETCRQAGTAPALFRTGRLCLFDAR